MLYEVITGLGIAGILLVTAAFAISNALTGHEAERRSRYDGLAAAAARMQVAALEVEQRGKAFLLRHQSADADAARAALNSAHTALDDIGALDTDHSYNFV